MRQFRDRIAPVLHSLPPMYSYQQRFESFNSFAIANAFANVLDVYYLLPQIDIIRNTAAKAHFVRKAKDLDGEYYVSVHFPNPQTIGVQEAFSRLLDVGHTVSLSFKAQTRRIRWKALVIEDPYPHTGRLMLKTRRPREPLGDHGEANLSQPSIRAADSYSPTRPAVSVWLEPTSPETTPSRRVAAVARLVEKETTPRTPRDTRQLGSGLQYKDGPESSQHDSSFHEDMKCILQGAGLKNPARTYSFIPPQRPGTREAQVLSDLLSLVGSKLRPTVKEHLSRVPQGLLNIVGPAGTGKTFLLGIVANMLFLAGKKVSACAPSQAAVDSLAVTASVVGSKVAAVPLIINGHVVTRELQMVMHFLTHQHDQSDWNKDTAYDAETSAYNGGPWSKSLSLAECFLKFIGQLDCTTPKILALRRQERTLMEDLLASLEEWGKASTNYTSAAPFLATRFRTLTAKALRLLVREADMVVTTAHNSLEPPYKPFTESAAVYMIDEASATTIGNALIGWRQSKPLVLAGDPRQLTCVAPSEDVTVDGRLVNPLAEFYRTSIQERITKLGWPTLVLALQRRICPGGLGPARETIYKGWNLRYVSAFQTYL